MFLKFMFFEKAAKIDEIFIFDLTVCNVKSTVKISSVCVVFLENMNFTKSAIFNHQNEYPEGNVCIL